MADELSTAERVLAAARERFNERGYAVTSLKEIATAVGISQGNLTYHFPTKRDLVERLEADVRARMAARRSALRPGDVAEDYVEHLLFAMDLTWENRFLLRDRAQFADAGSPPDPDLAADFEELRGLLGRLRDEGCFRRDLRFDVEVLTRSLWIVSRYWLDHLREAEGPRPFTWADQERGIRHHLAVLLPYLTAAGRTRLEQALSAASAGRASS